MDTWNLRGGGPSFNNILSALNLRKQVPSKGQQISGQEKGNECGQLSQERGYPTGAQLVSRSLFTDEGNMVERLERIRVTTLAAARVPHFP